MQPTPPMSPTLNLTAPFFTISFDREFSIFEKRFVMIFYSIENDLSHEEFIDVLNRSTLAERRPVGEPDRIDGMLKHGNLIVTARDNGKLVGVGRSLTDFAFCTYMSDLAVDEGYQKQGIGKELIRQTKLASPKAKLILLAAPKAVNYYPRIGMTQHAYCYYLDDEKDLV